MNDARQQFLLDVPEPVLDEMATHARYQSKHCTAVDQHVLAAWWMQFAASVLAVQALRADEQLNLLDDVAEREADPF